MGKVYYLSALNIKTHPHSPEQYIELLRSAQKNMLSAQYNSDRHAMIGLFYQRDTSSNDKIYEGQILSFLNINSDDPWLNTFSEKLADEEDVKKVIIPEHLRPSVRTYHFIFFAQKHRLVYESKTTEGHSLGPSSAKKIFSSILNNPILTRKFGEVDVIIEPQVDALDKILGIAQLKKLKVFVTRPNADDTEDAEIEIMRRLRNMNAQSHEEEYKARNGESLSIDNELRTFAKVGSHNGFVEGSGRNSLGEPTTESTKSHPLKVRGSVEKKQLRSDSILSRAIEVISMITGR
ncbi:DUF4747 family protein [Vreelandella stevensii]|uniref:DUF4747 family protein n=1 Tax=Vreelandella stevensii TaxID=502821 RepID=UPI00403B2DDE